MDASAETLMKIEEWNERFHKANADEILAFFLNEFNGKIALASSLGAEDQVLTDKIVKIDPEARIFTLDTGRLFPETYDLIAKTNDTYKINIDIFFPDAAQVEDMVNKKGINLFYHSVENRKFCCGIRKVEPLKRAFKDLDAWICGLRKDQSVTRFYTKLIEWDASNGLIKINPLLGWTEKQVWEYIKKNGIPYNVLHDKGFPSIGCQPCTRSIEVGEDVRAGRWWWEQPDQKECGLHSK
jgi:phosphoadenosine phosphosulfate reductase